MKNFKLFTILIFIAYISISLELCPKDMNTLKLSHLSNYTNGGFMNYFYKGGISILALEVHLEIEKDFGFASIILSNDLKNFEVGSRINNSYEIEFNEDITQKESFLQIKQCFQEKNASPSKANKNHMKKKLKLKL